MRTRRSVWLSFVWCWFDRRFYDEQARFGRGLGFLPLLAISVALSVVSTAATGWSYYSAVTAPEVANMIDSMPDVQIRDGVVSSTAEQPLVWEIEEDGERLIMVLDTTGQYSDFPPGVTRGLMLLKTEAHVLRSGRRDIHDLSEIDELDVTAPVVWEWITFIGAAGIPILGAMQVCLTLVVRLVIAMAVGALIMGLGTSHNVGWTGGVRVAMYGMFPAMILFGSISTTGVFSGFWVGWWFVSLALSAPFWILGVMSLGSTQTDDDDVGRASSDALDGHVFAAPSDT
ncbi:MAG: hypothetical protein ACI9MC_004300 [Kiritimatiellia bacterium]|jgi:hypothetical protein